MKLNKINIMYPMLILALIFSILTFNLIKSDYEAYKSLIIIKDNVLISTKISSIVHEIQIERGLSVAYLVSKNEKFKFDLEKQRKQTDNILTNMKNKISDDIIYSSKLQQIRKKIDQHKLKSSEILGYYSKLNDKLLSSIVNIAQNSTSPEITKNLTSYSNFLFSKELIGIERAIGTEIISSNTLKQDKILEFYSLIIRQKEYKDKLFKYAPVDYKINYERFLDSKSQVDSIEMENIILSLNAQKISSIDVGIWFDTLSTKINNLTLFERYISGEIIKSIEKELLNVTYVFIFNIFLNIINVVVFLLIVIFIFKLTKNEKKLKKLTDDYIISSTTDTKGVIISASQAFVDISGYSEAELIGRSHNIVRHSDMADSVFKNLWKTIKSGNVWEGEVKNRKKTGEHYWTKSSIIPQFDSRNNIIGYFSIRHDITSEKSKEEFMANMSHELRTPLNSIIGFSDILNKKIKDANNLKYIHRVGSSARVLLKLINDILDLSKIKDSKFTIEPYEFNAYDEVSQYSDTFKSLTSEKNISLKIEIDTKLQALFFGDWIRISQIILNIISNAIKFTPKDGKVIFIIEYKNDNLVFSVQDNGIGMKKEVQDKIFLPFEQADGSTTRRYGGTGLGLSITQSLVELMNGNISLESKEGEGSTFIITIPLKKIQDVKPKTVSVVENINEKELYSDHILVAEDNMSNQMLIELLLKELGITCDMVANGEEAVAEYDPSKHSFILMDENMPKMNGLVAMQTLKQKYGEQCGKVIALTANTMSGDKEKFLKLGMDDYLSKPIETKELERILKLYAKPIEDNAYLYKAFEMTKEKTKFPEKTLKKLLTSYYQSSLRLLESLEKGIKENDYEVIEKSAHDMKSTSQSLNYIHIGQLSETMEEKAKNREEFNYLEIFNAFKKHTELLKEFLV